MAVGFGNHLAAIDLDWGHEQCRVHSLVSLTGQKIREDDYRTLEMLCEVEGPRNGREAIGNASRRDDDSRKVALASAKGLVEIALLGLGRYARGRTGPLHIDHN